MGMIEQKLGELLKIERERRQIKLETICTDLKIPLENLEGIEQGDLSLLPTPVYYNLFARTYCQSLGIDYNRTLEAIKEELSLEQKSSVKPKAIDTQKDSEETDQPSGKSIKLNTPKKKLVGAVAVLLLVFFGYIAFDMFIMAGGNKKNGSSEMLKGMNSERVNSLAGFNWDVSQYKSPSEIKIDLNPRSESWSTVIADGDTVIFRRLVPGKIYTASAKYRLVVSIGVPQSVDVQINGRMVDLRDPVSQRVSRIEINQANLEAYLNPSLENLPPAENLPLKQGSLEPDTLQRVSVTKEIPAITDTVLTATDKDES